MPTTEELAAIAEREFATARAREVLLANRDIPFIRRMLNPQDYPALWSEEGVPRTVRLGTYGFDGTDWVVPEVAYQGGQLVEGKGADWARGQIDRGNAIAFADAALAGEFAEGSWKQLAPSVWDDLRDTIGRPAPRRAPRQAPSRYLGGSMEGALTREWAPITPPVP